MRNMFVSGLVGSAIAISAPASAQLSCPGDLVADGRVDGLDLGVLLAYWGPTTAIELSQAADLNQDTVVDGSDLGLLLARWGFCRPVVTAVSPASGCFLGGTEVTITGSWLAQVSSITVGGNPCTGVTPVSSTTVLATVPPGSVGTFPIVVTGPGGSATAAIGFTYGAASITSILPNVARTTGGASVTISGSYFGGATAVRFGGIAATSFFVIDPGRIIAEVPAGVVGNATVEVDTPKGVATVASAFRYVADPVAPPWATVIEEEPDPSIVTDPLLRQAVIASGWVWRIRDQSTQIEMLFVPAGSFQMGCSAMLGQSCDGDNPENPVHAVAITQGFYMGRYEVSQSQWVARMGSNPSYTPGESHPVERVSRIIVGDFLASTGMRLPTEAEWEYACRAGTVTAFNNGSDDGNSVWDVAWGWANSSGQSRPVGLKPGNRLGLHDMHGNVWEFVSDWYSGTYYVESPAMDPAGPSTGTSVVLRGGSWHDLPEYLRSSKRGLGEPNLAFINVGFRVARNP